LAARDGSLFIADYYGYLIRQIDPNGIISRIAGPGESGTCVAQNDGMPANGSAVCALDLAIGKDNNLYFVDGRRVRMIDAEGKLQTVAGNDVLRYGGCNGSPPADGLLAKDVALCPTKLAFDSQGRLYVANSGDFYHVIRVELD